MEYVFKAQKKKIRVEVEGKSYNMNCPSMDQADELDEKINEATKNGGSGKSIAIYREFFTKELGLDPEALKGFDADDFIGLVKYVMGPKKNFLSET